MYWCRKCGKRYDSTAHMCIEEHPPAPMPIGGMTGNLFSQERNGPILERIAQAAERIAAALERIADKLEGAV